MTLNNELFKKIIILFWTMWWLIALWTDIVGALAHIGMLTATWAPDTNYPFLASSLKMYQAPEWLVAFLFMGILVWSLLVTLVFAWASMGLMNKRAIWMRRAEIAFIFSLAYWLAFIISDQIVMKFSLEANHIIQAGFELLTFFAMYLLPENKN